MTHVTRANETPSILDYLRKPDRQSELNKNKRMRFIFITHLLEMFGKRFATQVKAKLNKTMASKYTQVSEAYDEIRNKKREFYDPLELPLTKALFNEYGEERQGDQQFYRILKTRMIRCFPFPQILLTNPQIDRETVASIEAVREQAFRQMSRFFFYQPDEKKEEIHSPVRAMSSEEELAVGKLYYNGGAFIFNERSVFFSDLIAFWGGANEQLRTQFLNQLTMRNWVEEKGEPRKDLIRFVRAQRGSFRSYLIECTIEAVETNLQLHFSAEVQKILRDAFQNESIRSDLGFFSGDVRGLYQMDLSRWDRPSGFYLASFQIYFFLVQSCGVQREKQEKLLEYLLKRSPTWKGEIEGFVNRQWVSLENREEDPHFTQAWEGLENILNRIPGTPVGLEHWSLLFLSLNRPIIAPFMRFFPHFLEHPSFVLNLPMIHRFCSVSDSDDPLWETFEQKYLEVLEVLKTRGIELKNAQNLFINPPISEESDRHMAVQYAPERAARFVDQMWDYSFPVDDRYVYLLRHFISDPNILLFELLKGIQLIGIEDVTEDLLWRVLSVSHSPIQDPDFGRFQNITTTAQQYAYRLHQTYGFSDVDTFFLYLELIRLITAENEQVIKSMAQVIRKLEEFCPSIRKEDILFFYLYHPQVDIREVLGIIEARKGWARDEEELNRFIINPIRYQGIILLITKFVSRLAEACDREEVRNPFMNTLQHSLLSAFFPPLQPLTDYFRISNLTIHGEQWNGPHLGTHRGQVKFLLGKSNLGVYFNWDILKGFPTLFISFLDTKKKVAFSAYFSLNVPAAEIEAETKRKPFYSLLFFISQQVLREEADRPNVQDRSETPSAWIPCFTGLAESIDSFSQEIQQGNLTEEQVEKIWQFLREVKIGYRKLFLTSVGDRPLPPNAQLENDRIAAGGNIYHSPTSPRGSLIPDDLLGVEIHPKFYLPDANERFVEQCMGVFQVRTRGFIPLNLDMNVNIGNNTGWTCPIFYQVQTADDLEAMDRSDDHPRSDIALGQEQIQGFYVTMSAQLPGTNWVLRVPLKYPPEAFQDPSLFTTYFDTHNLLLKSKFYYELGEPDPLRLEENTPPLVIDRDFEDLPTP